MRLFLETGYPFVLQNTSDCVVGHFLNISRHWRLPSEANSGENIGLMATDSCFHNVFCFAFDTRRIQLLYEV